MRYIIILLFAVLLVSCQDNIDSELTLGKGKRKLVVYAFPSTSDSIFIDACIGKTRNEKTEKPVIKSIECLVNGKKDEIVCLNDNEENGIYGIRFCAVGKHAPGDTITINVSAEGVLPVSGSTIIPQKPKAEYANMDTVPYKGDIYSRILFNIHDSKPIEYYAACTVAAVDTDNDLEKYETVELEVENEPLLKKYASTKFNFETNDSFYGNMYIFDNETFRNSSALLHLHIMQQPWYNAFKVKIYSLSKEYFNMLRSLNNSTNNDFGKYGMAFIYSSYSNVENGYGCIAAYNVTESNWIK